MAKSAIVLALAVACLSSLSSRADARVDALHDMLSGSYNNNEQVWQQGLDEVTQQPREHWSISASDDRALIALAEGQAAGETRWQLDTQLNSQGLFSLVETAAGEVTECVINWIRHSDGYLGKLQKRRACDDALPDELLVNPGYLVATYKQRRDDRVVQARRAKHYRGWISLKRNHIDEQAADDDYIFLQGLRFHDEGFIAQVLDDGEPTGYAVELAKLTYQRTQIPILKIGIIDERTGKTVSYAWADQGAGRIGINLRWIQAGLTAE